MFDRQMFREFAAELFGTFLLLSIGFSAIFLNFIYPTEAFLKYNDCGKDGICYNGKGQKAKQLALTIEMQSLFIPLVVATAFGSGIVGAITATGHISGAHFNPCITITNAALSKMPWKKVIHYIPAQYLGGFLSAAAVHMFHLSHIELENGDDFTKEFLEAMLTKPHKKIGMFTAMADAMLSGYVLMIFIMAVTDKNGSGVPTSLHPIYIFICFCGVLCAFVSNAGASLNPARDLGPRLYVAIFVGFDKVFQDFWYCFWWLPQQICVTLGFYLGGLTYYSIFEKIEVTQN